MNNVKFLPFTDEQLKRTTTPQEFEQAVINGLKDTLEDFKKHFQPKEPVELLTRQEVAEFFKVDISTIHNWQKRKKLKPFGMVGRVYFKRSDIEKALVKL